MMKNFINKLSFLFKISIRNIFSSKLRAFILFFSSTIIVILFFLVFSLNTFFCGFFESSLKEDKGNSDIFISIDDNYGARYFSVRSLNENFNKEYYNHIVNYFKFSSLSYIDDNFSYVDIIMSDLDSFKKTGNFSEYAYNLLESNEILITKSFAKQKCLAVDDSIFLQMGSEKLNYKIAGIVEDGGLLKGSTIFLDKNSNIKNILVSIYPQLENLNSYFFNNLCNGAYLYLNENILISDVINSLQDIKEYQDLNIAESINKEEINVLVNRNTAYFSVGILMVLISILFVVYSSLIVIFNDRLKQLGIIKTLGGKEKDFIITILFEIFFYLFTAIIIGPILCMVLMGIGLDYIGSNYVFEINFLNLVYTLISLIILYGFVILFSYLKVKKLNINKIIRVSKYKSSSFIKYLIFCVAIILFILSNVLLKENNLLKYKGVINYILIIIIGIFSAKIIISLVAAILKKRSLFGLIFVDDVNRNNISKSILIILLVAFTSIVIFVGLTRVDERRVEKLYDETIIDLAITNIIREDDLELYLSNSTNVDVYEKGILYNNVVMNKEVSFFQMISVKNINYFFDFEIITSEINEFNNSNYPVVFIPIEYQYLYNFSIGDEITLSLNEAYSEVPFKIIGFFSSNYEDLILTNLFLLEEYSILNYNTYFINSNNKNILKNELIDKYSKNLYYIIDFEELINEIDIYSKNLRTFLSFLSLFFVFCFVFTIINNSLLLFESNKNIFARLKILGCSKNNLRKNIILQYLLITFVCIICSSFAVFVIMFNVKYILLFFNVYQEIKLIFSDFIIGYIISSIVFFLSYLYYIKLSLNLNINVVLNDIEQ